LKTLPATPHALDALTEALRRLPGIGPKTAQRLALHLLQHDRAGAELLGQALLHAVQSIQHCRQCNTFTEEQICQICASLERDPSQLCVVESPSDGIGPKEIHLDRLVARVANDEVREVVIATNFTPEGEATAHAIETLLRSKGLVDESTRRISRLARGVPVGGELEYIDLGTIAQAMRDRKKI